MSVRDLVLTFALALVFSIWCVGCGNAALQTNATVARAMLEVQAESGPLVRELRIDAATAAAREVHATGGNEAAAQAAATSAASRWQCAIDTHRIYSTAVGSYIDTLVLWQAGRDFELSDSIPFVARALDAYRALTSCLSSLGSDALPTVPSFLDLIPSAWGVAGQ